MEWILSVLLHCAYCLTCLSHVSGLSHTSHTCLTCLTCLTHVSVSHMSHTCLTCLTCLSVSLSCLSHVSHVSHPFHMSLTCLSHVSHISHMSLTCLTPVSHPFHMSHTCLSHVSHLSHMQDVKTLKKLVLHNPVSLLTCYLTDTFLSQPIIFKLHPSSSSPTPGDPAHSPTFLHFLYRLAPPSSPTPHFMHTDLTPPSSFMFTQPRVVITTMSYPCRSS